MHAETALPLTTQGFLVPFSFSSSRNGSLSQMGDISPRLRPDTKGCFIHLKVGYREEVGKFFKQRKTYHFNVARSPSSFSREKSQLELEALVPNSALKEVAGAGGEVSATRLGSAMTGRCFPVSSTHLRPLWGEYAVLERWGGRKKPKAHHRTE